MEISRFDALVRSLHESRRALLGAAIALAAGPLTLLSAEAKKKRKKKKKRKVKKAQPNEFGCLEVSNPCTSEDQCCSGVCEGKKGRKTCRAHDSGGCAAGSSPYGCGGTDVACTTTFGLPGTCATTTGNAGYCQTGGDCFACKTDADCQAVLGDLLGPNAACIRCWECAETGGVACAVAVLEEG